LGRTASFAAVFFLFLSASPASAAELTLYFYPSPGGVNWESPKTLARSVMGNSLTPSKSAKHSIGHVSVRWNCFPPMGEAGEFQTGMTTATDSEERDLLLSKNVGLGILFHTFEGRLQEEREIESDLEARLENGKVSWITFEIREPSCLRLVQYYDEFRGYGYDRFYGLPLRPLYREGAGCSAFGASFLELAGVLEPEFRERWTRQISVPLDLIGDPATKKEVGILTLLFSGRADRWARADEPHRDVFFWDPDLMHRWVLEKWQAEKRSPSPDYRREKRGKALGLIVDRMAVPTPRGPIWNQQ
jgi:hypothetical protein